MDEFSIIAKYFAPLSKGEKGAFSLTDDAAVIKTVAAGNMVITKDSIVEGVHFLPTDPPELIARKLMRVNVSDLVAKGARPVYYLLAATFRKGIGDEWIEKFADGLRKDQRTYGMKLIGGDTTSVDGPMSFSLTAIGEAEKPVLRRGAKAGDVLYVTGSIGDSCIGLKFLSKDSGFRIPDSGENTRNSQLATGNYFINRYHLPEPRTLVGMHIARVATASVDVSDGLVADVGHICENSGVAAIIRAGSVPLSRGAKKLVREKKVDIAELISHGDDYEIAFTAAKVKTPIVYELAKFAGVQITQVGEIVSGKGVWVVDAKGRPVSLPKSGYKHF